MFRPIAVVFRAYRVLPVTACVAVLLVAMVAKSEAAIGFGGVPIRWMWFLMLAVAVLGTLPLVPAFGVLETTLVRAKGSRGLRAAWHFGGTAAATTIAVARSPDLGMLVWFVCLSAVALGCATVQPEAGVLLLLAVGGGTILVDHLVLNDPVSRAMAGLGLWWAGAIYLSSVAGYLLLSDVIGVRRNR